MDSKRPPPIVEYARKVGKSTAEFTANDLSQFMRWWMKQPLRKDLIMFNQKGAVTGRKTFKTMEEAGMSEINDIEQIDESEVEELTEQYEENSDEIIAELGLTKKDVQALGWALNEVLSNYDFHEWSEVGDSLQSIKEAIDGVETTE